MNKTKRIDNERKFDEWIEINNSGRIYRLKIIGKFKGYAIYEKEVDKGENTIKFTQFIYDEDNTLKWFHEKYPIDKGHKKI